MKEILFKITVCYVVSHTVQPPLADTSRKLRGDTRRKRTPNYGPRNSSTTTTHF